MATIFEDIQLGANVPLNFNSYNPAGCQQGQRHQCPAECRRQAPQAWARGRLASASAPRAQESERLERPE
eukprot:14636388-Alexandrium_andersonii.AAC.1